MRPRSVLRLALTGLLAVALQAVPDPAGAAGQRLFTLSDPRLTEASGLAFGHRSPSVLYLHNDSGDSARFFAVDAVTGRTRAVCDVPGARNVDWEDLGTAPDRRGVASVWLADIGDNDSQRPEIAIYRVDEPVIGAAPEIVTAAPDRWRLRYPDGPHDAESMIVDPVRHRLYLVTKSLFGHSEVFSVPPSPDPQRVQPMTKIASLSFGLTGTPGGPNIVGQLTATGASMSPDGAVLAIRTYTDAYLWPVTGGDLALALRQAPVRLPLPAQPQGEAVAVGNGFLLIGSEGAASAVYRLPVPPLTSAPTQSASEPAPLTSAPTQSASKPAPLTSAPTQSGLGRPARHDTNLGRRAGQLAIGGAAVVLGALAVLLVLRKRRPAG